MSFSATGNLLPGSMQRPEIVTFKYLEQKPSGEYTRILSVPCRLNILGYIPLVGSVTGLGRTLLGMIHTITHLSCAIFSKNKDHHLAEAKLGVKNIARGLIEVIPVIGNITMLIVDQVRMIKFEKAANNQIEKNEAVYRNHAIMFVNGQEFAKRPIDEFKPGIVGCSAIEFKSEMEKFNRKPTVVRD